MWHEARKQEKKLRLIIVDYRKRAERRREFYEKFKLDPTQFIQLHGRQCKVHVDAALSAAAEKCLMPWQGHAENMIDRFDGRAHLDLIPEAGPTGGAAPTEEEEDELNYERYRILIQNEVAGIPEDKFLHQIHIEEQFGTVTQPSAAMLKEKEKKQQGKAAIGYSYEGTTTAAAPAPKNEESEEEDMDFDLIVNVGDLTIAQTSELNTTGQNYGLKQGSFMRHLNADVEERERAKRAKVEEEARAAMSGRKARRERRAFKDRIILRKGHVSPPSYAATGAEAADASPTAQHHSSSDSSRSGSTSPEKITFITSFGVEPEKPEEKKARKSWRRSPPQSGRSSATAKRYKRKRSRSRSRERRRRRSTSSSSGSRSRRRSDNRHRKRRSRSGSRSRRSPPRRHRSRDLDRGKRRRSSSSSSSSSSSPAAPPRRECEIEKPTAKQRVEEPLGEPAPPPIRRYYRAGLRDDDESPLSLSSEEEPQKGRSRRRSSENATKEKEDRYNKKPTTTVSAKNKSAATKGSTSASTASSSTTSAGLTPAERLRRRMQAALTKQLRADKEAEKTRMERLEQERMDREESMREISIKWRRRERERRHGGQESPREDSSPSSAAAPAENSDNDSEEDDGKDGGGSERSRSS